MQPLAELPPSVREVIEIPLDTAPPEAALVVFDVLYYGLGELLYRLKKQAVSSSSGLLCVAISPVGLGALLSVEHGLTRKLRMILVYMQVVL